MQKNLFIYTFSAILLCSFLFVKINALSKYCSAVNREELIQKFDNCSKSRYTVLATINRLSSLEDQNVTENYNNILNMLKRVLLSIEEGNSTKNDTKHLFLDILRMVEIVSNHNQIKFCFVSICNLFKNCEFPINIEYKNFENDAMVASRVAALLTALTYNERIENKTYLTKMNLNSLLKLTVLDNINIYDSKIIFKFSPDLPRFAFQATKNLEDKSKLFLRLKLNFLFLK
jgi:hypothetical protein